MDGQRFERIALQKTDDCCFAGLAASDHATGLAGVRQSEFAAVGTTHGDTVSESHVVVSVNEWRAFVVGPIGFATTLAMTASEAAHLAPQKRLRSSTVSTIRSV